ncbi:MAG: cytochrome c biogenesis CcdA family protein, partial [Candidatus Thorarchaeota archaeon]
KIQETIEVNANRISAGYGFSLATAFVAGVLSFFSPCAFPLLPGYMAFNLDLLVKDESKDIELQKESGGEEISNKKRVRKRVWKSFLWGSSAALGVALFYMIIGLIAAFVGEAVGQWVEYITPVIGGLLIILGIISLTPLSFDMSFAINKINNLIENRRKKKGKITEDGTSEDLINGKKKRNISSETPQMFQLFLYGITYALASIGCNLPILLGLTLSAIEAGRFDKAIIIFVIYSLAMALLMIIITTLVGFSKDILINKLRSSTKFVKIFSGVLLILAGGFLIGYFLWNFFDK